jgi:hypothetical protein
MTMRRTHGKQKCPVGELVHLSPCMLLFTEWSLVSIWCIDHFLFVVAENKNTNKRMRGAFIITGSFAVCNDNDDNNNSSNNTNQARD